MAPSEVHNIVLEKEVQYIVLIVLSLTHEKTSGLKPFDHASERNKGAFFFHSSLATSMTNQAQRTSYFYALLGYTKREHWDKISII